MLRGKIYTFPDSSYELSGKAYVFGETSSPRMRGGFEIKNLSIPELIIDLRNFALKFRVYNSETYQTIVTTNELSFNAK